MRRRIGAIAIAFVLGIGLALAASPRPKPPSDPYAQLGRLVFSDVSLSASGRQSCASCHVPAAAHAQDNALPIQFGGPGLDVPGFRSVPTLRYLSTNQPFSFAKDGTPTGGFNWDGRADSLMEQAERPFLAPHEMANGTRDAVVARLRNAPYADEFRRLFWPDIFDRGDEAFLAALYAIEQFELKAPEFHPFDSKFDYYLRGRARLSAAERRGKLLFERPDKGNCSGCHTSKRGPQGQAPLFTDFTYDNLGVPRNPLIPANDDPAYFDLGLCGPSRTDLAGRDDLCGAFKVPSLRNVATRKVFFHNGRFTSLRETILFYVSRDTSPERFYPRRPDGAIAKFDDLPESYKANVNADEVPYDRRPGEAPRLSELEIDDVIAFLQTLTDGYDPRKGDADPARDVVR